MPNENQSEKKQFINIRIQMVICPSNSCRINALSLSLSFLQISYLFFVYFANLLTGFGDHQFRFLFSLHSNHNSFSDSNANRRVSQLKGNFISRHQQSLFFLHLVTLSLFLALKILLPQLLSLHIRLSAACPILRMCLHSYRNYCCYIVKNEPRQKITD